MAWLKALVAILKNAPYFIGLFQKVAGWIEQQIIDYETKKKLEEMERAIEKAKKDKDTSGVDDLFGKP